MKTKFFLLLVLLFNISLAQPKKWTVMVYMNADNDLEEFGIKDFIEMGLVKNSDDVNILVQMDRTPEETTENGNWTQTLRFKVTEKMEPNYEDRVADLGELNMGDPNVLKDFIQWGKANYPAENYILIIWDHGDGWRFRESKNLDDKVKSLYIDSYKEELLAELEIERQADEKALSILRFQVAGLQAEKTTLSNSFAATAKAFRFLPAKLKSLPAATTDFSLLQSSYNDFLISNIDKLPAEQYAIAEQYTSVVDNLTDTNRAIERYNEQIIRLSTKEYALPANFAQDLNFVETEPVKAVSHDDTDGDVLFNREIQDILANGEVDIIGFDACLMSMLETAYALKDKAGYIIGSEELEPGDGWNYKLWLEKLVSNPSMKPIDLCKAIVSSYQEEYPNKSDVTLSAIHSANTQKLGEKISELSKALKGKMNNYRQAIADSRKLCKNYAPRYPTIQSIDLLLFVHHLQTKTNDLNIKNLCSQISILAGAMVVANHVGSGRAFKPSEASYGSHGIAIYFPEKKDFFDPAYTDKNKVYEVQFVKDFEWDNFLQSYLR